MTRPSPSPSRKAMRARLLPALVLPLLLGACGGLRPLWRAGASRVGHEGVPLGAPRDPDGVVVAFKAGFGPLATTETRRRYVCASTTVLRKAFVLEPPAGLDGAVAGDYAVVADLTTEEFPRDEVRSVVRTDRYTQVLGVGGDAFDCFDVRLDPAFLPDALARLRALAAGLGADGVVDVYATGAAEHHMWEGDLIGLDPRATDSPIYADVRLLNLRLRDVRLHGTAVRFDAE